MRIAFAGTPTFAAVALEAIVEAGFEVPLVLTQPDRPRGRGLALQPTAVKSAALRRGLLVRAPESLRAEGVQRDLQAIAIDVLVVAAYGLILPPAVLAWPRLHPLNIHASLLPRWRGAAPIQRAILAGDRETGITIMRMDAGLDSGPIVAAVAVPIGPRDTTGSLLERLAALGAVTMVATLQRLARQGTLALSPQANDGVTYAAKIDRAEARIDWTQGAAAIDRQVRAFDPVPGAHCVRDGHAWKVWDAVPSATSAGGAAPGTVVDLARDAFVVACGEGTLHVSELQVAGGRRLGAAALIAGGRVRRGDRFE